MIETDYIIHPDERMELQSEGLILTSEYAGVVVAYLLQTFLEENDTDFLQGFVSWLEGCEGWQADDIKELCSFLNQKAVKISKDKKEFQAWHKEQWSLLTKGLPNELNGTK